MSTAPRRKVRLIGWDAADRKVIDPLVDQGLMPNLERLVNAGVDRSAYWRHAGRATAWNTAWAGMRGDDVAQRGGMHARRRSFMHVQRIRALKHPGSLDEIRPLPTTMCDAAR